MAHTTPWRAGMAAVGAAHHVYTNRIGACNPILPSPNPGSPRSHRSLTSDRGAGQRAWPHAQLGIPETTHGPTLEYHQLPHGSSTHSLTSGGGEIEQRLWAPPAVWTLIAIVSCDDEDYRLDASSGLQHGVAFAGAAGALTRVPVSVSSYNVQCVKQRVNPTHGFSHRDIE